MLPTLIKPTRVRVGLIARTIGEAEIPTVFIGSCRDMMKKVKPPKAAFLNFPLGHQCGKPDDVDLQTTILKETLDILASASTPGDLVDLPFEWDQPYKWPDFMKGIEEILKEEGASIQL